MQIQVNTDNQVEGNAELTRTVEGIVENSLGRFRDRITRLEVHVNDVNGRAKAGDDDMRCAIEARLAGLDPITVTHNAAFVEQAVKGAADKLKTTLDRTLGRLNDRKGGTSAAGDQTL